MGKRPATYGTYRFKIASGYVLLRDPDHPLADHNGNVAEHRKVAYDAGLFGDESYDRHVHHKNGVKDDNRVENLEVLTCAEHNRQHAHQFCPRCGGSRWAYHRNAGDRSGIQRRCLDCEATKHRERRRARNSKVA